MSVYDKLKFNEQLANKYSGERINNKVNKKNGKPKTNRNKFKQNDRIKPNTSIF